MTDFLVYLACFWIIGAPFLAAASIFMGCLKCRILD